MMNCKAAHQRFAMLRERMLGYPLDLSGECSWEPFYPLMDFVLNNLGDPRIGGAYGLNTFQEELEVLRWFAELFHLAEPIGYVTSCGSEGNLRGITEGLERFPSALVVASDKAHYSVDKACRLARANLVRIPSLNHALDVGRFSRFLRYRMNEVRRSGIVLCLTSGTTMGGAVDRVAEVDAILTKHGIERHIHLDAALFGLLTPFLTGHAPDFRAGIDSISVSGHKMLGVPVPCGVYLSRHQPTGRNVEYIRSEDSTIGGSRSGLAVLLLQHALGFYGRTGLTSRAKRCALMAEAACDRLRGTRFDAHSNIVVIHRPPENVVRRWQLAVDDAEAHVVCMPHVTARMIQEFASDLNEFPARKTP